MVNIKNILIYPIKSLGEIACDDIKITAHHIFPNDRQWAISHAGSDIEPQQWYAKKHFVVTAFDHRLAALSAQYDAINDVFSIIRKNRVVASGALHQASGRLVLETFLNGYFADSHRKKLQLHYAGDNAHLCDDSRPLISLLNLNSVKDMERIMGKSIDPRRFRANLWCDDLPAWAERNLIGEVITIQNIRFQVVENIGRCQAINVNLDSGVVDANLVMSLKKGLGHDCCGVFLEALDDGILKISS